MQASDGNFYGTTYEGGSNNGCSVGDGSCGSVFKITPGGALTTLHTFAGYPTDGGNPWAGLVQASDGNFYGTTSDGGTYTDGTVFKITPSGTLTTLYSFCGSQQNCSDGAYSEAGLVQATDGNFYGTTPFGGANCRSKDGCGTVFKITPSGSLTTLHSFDGSDGKAPFGGLVQATDGNFYGTATYGANPACTAVLGGCGTVFRLTGPPPSTTTVTSSPNPSTFGELVTITATVSPSGATGTVGFTSNGTAISGCTAVPLSSQVAVCVTTSLAVGTDAIVATYSGDSNYSGSSGSVSQIVNPVPAAVQFVPLTPCRVVDTRKTDGTFGGPPITGGSFRSFPLPQGDCNVPADAAAYSLNVTLVPIKNGPVGYLTIWPAGEGQPMVSTMNSLDGRIKANAAIVPAGTNGAVNVYVSNTTNAVLDIDGYFTSSSGSTLAFYPLTPCRVLDTRNANGDLGGPFLTSGVERDFPVLESTCNIPSTAQAYSLNFTVVPYQGQSLGYLTVWPQGGSKPVVSTLNNLTATIVANGAIVPAGTNGGIATYPSGNTQLVADIDGYFAPAGTGGLSLYTLTPCRVIDTRKGSGQFSGELTVNVVGSPCAPPSTAQAYVFNATVVPVGGLGYLTLWPDSQGQPKVSTLNATDGAITSNMAIVPNINGKTDAFASGTTQLILDISSYFAP